MLRNYQIQSISQIQNHFRAGGKKALLYLACGAGKTVIFSHILKECAARGKHTMMVVKGISLVEQAHKRLLRENVRHGVKQGNHWYRDEKALIQLCSVDTLLARNERPKADLIVVDECHLAVSENYKKILSDYPNAFLVAVTATPFCKQSMKHLGEVVVHPITMQDLTDQGYLVPGRYFAPSQPDLKGVKTSQGDFVIEQLEERMRVLTGDIVSHWKAFGENRPTLLFSVNVKHSLSLVEQFNDAGIPAAHIEAKHSQQQRDELCEKLKTGEIKIISNIGTMTTGVDLPFVSCLIMARPTQSYNLYVQMGGRATRPSEGKSDFILLDHSGNVLRHGFLTDEPEVELEGVKKNKRELSLNTCAVCFLCFIGTICPACGAVKEVEKNKLKIETNDEILVELKGLPEAAEISIFVRRTKELIKKRGYKKGHLFYELERKYGREIASKVCKRRVIPGWVARK